jgi:ubiquinone/menaquinone biosynthesis C-methylase UbiE
MEEKEIKNFNEWAEIYDLVDGLYKEDIDFYIKEASKAKGKVLEIACGTGRIYLELLKKRNRYLRN